MTHDLQHGRNAAFPCRHFGISRQTFYRWKHRYDPENLVSLEDRSHRRRQPTGSVELAERVLPLRRQFPRWGKDKLVVLLRREGRRVSTSIRGRLLAHRKRRSLLVEPLRQRVTASRRPPRPYAVRKPKQYQPSEPGDLVQVNTLELRLLPGLVRKHFTARDVVSRWDVCAVHRRATALFLHTLLARAPFPLRAIQLHGAVERAPRTPTEEFYEVPPCSLALSALPPELQNWERIYNHVRPHQALHYQTPAEFLDGWRTQPKT